jgi:hypothetical protein
MKALIFLLLLSSVAFAAQKEITIPEGVTPFGPITVGALQKYLDLRFERSPTFTNSNVKASVIVNYSIDGGKTYQFMCGFRFQGEAGVPISEAPCLIPAGTTHAQGTITVTGGSITLTAVVEPKTRP